MVKVLPAALRLSRTAQSVILESGVMDQALPARGRFGVIGGRFYRIVPETRYRDALASAQSPSAASTSASVTAPGAAPSRTNRAASAVNQALQGVGTPCSRPSSATSPFR